MRKATLNTPVLKTTVAAVTATAAQPVNTPLPVPVAPPIADSIVVARTATPAVAISSRLRTRALTGFGRR